MGISSFTLIFPSKLAKSTTTNHLDVPQYCFWTVVLKTILNYNLVIESEELKMSNLLLYYADLKASELIDQL